MAITGIPESDWLGSAVVLTLAPDVAWPRTIRLPNAEGTVHVIGRAAWEAADFLTPTGSRRLVLLSSSSSSSGGDADSDSDSDSSSSSFFFLFPFPHVGAEATMAREVAEESLLVYAQLVVDAMNDRHRSGDARALLDHYAPYLFTDMTRRAFALLAFMTSVLAPHAHLLSSSLVEQWLAIEHRLASATVQTAAATATAAAIEAAHITSEADDLRRGLRLGRPFVTLTEALREGDIHAFAQVHVDMLRTMLQRWQRRPTAAAPLPDLGHALARALATDRTRPRLYWRRVGLPRLPLLCLLHEEEDAAAAAAAAAAAPQAWQRGTTPWRAPVSDAERRTRLRQCALPDLEDLATSAAAAPPCLQSLLAAGGLRDTERLVMATWLTAVRPTITDADALALVERVTPLAPDSRATFVYKLREQRQLQQEQPHALRPMPGCAFVIRQNTPNRLFCPFATLPTVGDAQRACHSATRIRHPLDHLLYKHQY